METRATNAFRTIDIHAGMFAGFVLVIVLVGLAIARLAGGDEIDPYGQLLAVALNLGGRRIDSPDEVGPACEDALGGCLRVRNPLVLGTAADAVGAGAGRLESSFGAKTNPAIGG